MSLGIDHRREAVGAEGLAVPDIGAAAVLRAGGRLGCLKGIIFLVQLGDVGGIAAAADAADAPDPPLLITGRLLKNGDLSIRVSRGRQVYIKIHLAIGQILPDIVALTGTGAGRLDIILEVISIPAEHGHGYRIRVNAANGAVTVQNALCLLGRGGDQIFIAVLMELV